VIRSYVELLSGLLRARGCQADAKDVIVCSALSKRRFGRDGCCWNAQLWSPPSRRPIRERWASSMHAR